MHVQDVRANIYLVCRNSDEMVQSMLLLQAENAIGGDNVKLIPKQQQSYTQKKRKTKQSLLR